MLERLLLNRTQKQLSVVQSEQQWSTDRRKPIDDGSQ